MTVVKFQKSFFSTLIFLVFISSASAQSSNEPGSWMTFGFNYRINEKLKIHSETQLRSQDIYNKFYYHEMRASLRYTPRDWLMTSVGISNHINFQKYGNFIRPYENETRIYEELYFKYSINRLYLENRNRLEQRFTPDGYRNRIRPRLALAVLLNNTKMQPGTYFLSFTEEMFFSDRFEKNQYYLGAGYRFDAISFTAGLKNDNNFDTDVVMNFIQLSLLVDI